MFFKRRIASPLMVGVALLLGAIAPGLMAQTSGIPSPLQGCVYTLAGGAQAQCTITKRPELVPVATPMPAASVPTAAVAPAPEHPKWELRLQDVTLAAAFSRWANTAGWRLLWDVDKHLLIDSPDIYMGTFEQVVSAVLSSPGLVHSQYPLEVCFYPNTPPLARITRRGDQSRDCK